MNDHATSNISNHKDIHKNGFIKAIEEDFKSCHNPELVDAAFTENSSERYQDCTSTKISKDQFLNSKWNFLPFVIMIVVEITNIVPESSEKNADLDGPACD